MNSLVTQSNVAKTREEQKPSSRLLLLLVASFVSYLVAIDWGLPNSWSWAADELVPELVLEAMHTHFSEGWHTQYPLLHFYLLALLYAPFIVFNVESTFPLALSGRLLSVAMGVGCVYIVYLLGRRFLNARWSLIGAAFFAFSPQTVYYSKLANLEIPYTFWLLLSFFFYWNIIERHKARDYLLCAFCAIAAICTKEQVFGFYVLLIPHLLYQRLRSTTVSKVVLDPVFVYCGLLVICCFLAFENVMFNGEGFVAHFSMITGAKYRSFRMFPNTFEGHWGMLKLSLFNLSYVSTIPILLLSLLGAGASLLKRQQQSWLLLAVLSYQLFFVQVVLYGYDRFFVPVFAVLALFAAYALSLVAVRIPRSALFVALTLLGYQLGRGIELDLLMVNDTRYEAEKWLEDVTHHEKTIGLYGQRRYLPRHLDYPKRRVLSPFLAHLPRIQPPPDCIMMCYLEPSHWPRNHPARDFLAALYDGRLDTNETFSAHQEVLGTIFFSPWNYLGTDLTPYSNLAKVSPDTRIYSVGGRCEQS